ncbi:MAG: AmmeMemoRadiSam system protein A [Actinobacteria bacterium]|nr:AmmeMemoRadiSam system protein A [Actinomycetota bacterium]
MTDAAKTGEDPLVSIARQAIETYIRDRTVIEPAQVLGLKPRRAGVFVSLHLPDGSLRGCIGTTEPYQPDIEQEIVANAISAATKDPRFYPLEASELDGLDISVDVLEAPEEVGGPEDLDVKEYGVIVRAIDGRRGLLLPDLDGVETVDQQIRIACRKGGIDPVEEQYSIFRFRVQRHH